MAGAGAQALELEFRSPWGENWGRRQSEMAAELSVLFDWIRASPYSKDWENKTGASLSQREKEMITFLSLPGNTKWLGTPRIRSTHNLNDKAWEKNCKMTWKNFRPSEISLYLKFCSVLFTGSFKCIAEWAASLTWFHIPAHTWTQLKYPFT